MLIIVCDTYSIVNDIAPSLLFVASTERCACEPGGNDDGCYMKGTEPALPRFYKKVHSTHLL